MRGLQWRHVLIFFVIIYSCKSRNGSSELDYNQRTIREYFDKNGILNKRQEFLKDSIADGYLKEFFGNQRLKHICYYKLGKKDSVEIWYYETGEQEERYFNWNDSINGQLLGFFKTGQLNYISNYVRGVKVGPHIVYFENGKVQGFYQYDRSGLLRYKRIYTPIGQILKEEGEGFTDILTNKNSNKLAVGDTFIANISIICPPHQNRKLSVLVKNPTLKEDEHFQINLDTASSYALLHYCKAKGTFTYNVVLKLEDSITHQVDSTYAVKFRLTVR